MPEDRRKGSFTPAFIKGKKEDLGNHRPVKLPSIPGKAMEQLILGVISKHMEEKKVIGSSQHGFTRRESCLTCLIGFCEGVTVPISSGWVSRGWGQAIFSGAQQQDEEQWARTETQEVPPEYEEQLLYFEGGRAQEQAAQRCC